MACEVVLTVGEQLVRLCVGGELVWFHKVRLTARFAAFLGPGSAAPLPGFFL